jgi:hypothetical protein
MQTLWQTTHAASEDVRSNNNQYHTPQRTTFAAFVASHAAIFGLKVERSGEVLEVSAKISDVTVAEMLITHCLNVLEGEVPDVYLLS